jgi:diguanylate cyclase (GGDEF)-like protein
MTQGSKDASPARPRAIDTSDDAILLIDDDPGALQLLGKILAGVGNILFATSAADALRIAQGTPPVVILLDAEMPGTSGFTLLEVLKADPVLSDVPVIFVTGHGEADFEVSALDMGAADFIRKPFRSSVVLARVKTQLNLKRMTDALRRDTLTDSLTGIANRRQFDGSLEREWLCARRDAKPLSLLMIDVDHFKLFNDRYGHAKGDSCLRNIAAALAATCRRPSDLAARCGGEEFMILLPMTPREGAWHMADRLLDAVRKLDIAHEDSPASRKVTVSIGIACYDAASDCWQAEPRELRFARDSTHHHSGSDLLLAADRAVYSAKRAGRDRAKLCDIGDAEALERSADNTSRRTTRPPLQELLT